LMSRFIALNQINRIGLAIGGNPVTSAYPRRRKQ
jgi:hypothetical protein